ncbi:MAG: HipA domain-containing protein, partial [Caulobacterales bacterium]
RNHAAFWDGASLRLTPAYDICPQSRNGREATQAMLIAGRERRSQLSHCIAAAGQFLLGEAEATDLIRQQVATIRAEWQATCDAAGLSQTDRALFWERQFLNAYAFEGRPDLAGA